ncbi:hypothetical protein DFR86_05875 [Acidianus sulfidivorans JP7]|uniref:Uncharacterized protein n=1 Tax=Acidianus sulfidivorans JP7 TaxID=619593 RepID=A0A2U9IM95_9CREN|nr:hypothetical protein [Acidianus sulfidivorans]AWR97133.1 hypothetical protein DFR86_05875 [Acidianus sulfidivorans JP7]
MSLLEKAKRIKEIGDEYEKLYNDILNQLFTIIPDCFALNMEDSLMPVYSVSALKTPNAILAFPYKCFGVVGYIVISDDNKIYFEDAEGNIKVIKELK